MSEGIIIATERVLFRRQTHRRSVDPASTGNRHQTGGDIVAMHLSLNLQIQPVYYHLQNGDLINQHLRQGYDRRWQAILGIFQDTLQTAQMCRALGCDDAKLGKVTSKCIDLLGFLANEQIAGTPCLPPVFPRSLRRQTAWSAGMPPHRWPLHPPCRSFDTSQTASHKLTGSAWRHDRHHPKSPPPLMSVGTGLHWHKAVGLSGEKPKTLARDSFVRKGTLSSARIPCT